MTALRVITTNGITNSRGAAVMGRGCALEARERFPGLDRACGEALRANGNHVWHPPRALSHGIPLATFPVKSHYKDPADLALIARSAAELLVLVNAEAFDLVIVPRPGCGFGGLRYEVVRPVLARLWDERFVVIDFDPPLRPGTERPQRGAKVRGP